MGSIDRFAWQEVKPGRWERDTDEIEQFYLALDRQYTASGRHFFAIMGHVSITLEVPPNQRLDECESKLEQCLRSAWLRLRYDHPTLASWVEFRGQQPRKVYESVDLQAKGQGGLDAWLDSTFRPVFTEKTGLDWCNSDPPVPRLPTLFVLKTSESLVDGIARQIVRRDLVLRAPHDIIDGIGTLMLFNNLIKHASDAYSSHESISPMPLFGDEHKNLSPSFRVAANLPGAITPQQLERIEDITASNASLRRDLPTLTVPFNQTSPTPGKHQRVSTTLSASKTTTILQACRAASLSVTHAYHTAIAIALRDIQPPVPTPTQKRYINYSLINERAHCSPPYNTPSHAAAVYHSTAGAHLALDLTIHPTPQAPAADFARLAPLVKNYYTAIRSDAAHPPLVPHYFTLATPTDPRVKDWASREPPPLPAPNASPSVSISSMGKVDEIVAARSGELEVWDPWVTGEELGTGLGAFLGTFRGELRLSVAYNEAYHERGEVEGFLERVQGVVEGGLRLEV